MNFDPLPSEITLKILSYLDCQGLTRIARTSKWLKLIADDNLLWKERIWIDYGLNWEEQGWDEEEEEEEGEGNEEVNDVVGRKERFDEGKKGKEEEEEEEGEDDRGEDEEEEGIEEEEEEPTVEEDEGTTSKSKKNPCLPSFAKQVYGRLLWRFGGAIGLWSKRHHKGNGLNGGCVSLA